MSITITGEKELRRAFEVLGKKAVNKEIRDQLRDDMKPAHQNIKAWAPVDEGDLQRAIVHRAMRRRRGFIGRSILVDPKKLTRAGDNEASKRLAGAFQEYGTKHIAEDPFMRPGFAPYEKGLATRTLTKIFNRLKAVMRKIAK